jgi:hypothetical protein
VVRRVAVAVLAFVSLLALSAVVADAASTKSVSYTATGSAEWNAFYYPSSFTISGQLYDGNHPAGSYTGTLFAGTYVYACSAGDFGPICAPVTGSVTFALRGGNITAVVEPGGLVTELCCPGPGFTSYIFDLSLTITGGTHAYAGAQGTLSLHYETLRDNLAWDPLTDPGPCGFVDITTCPITDNGTLTGTITR